MKFKNVFFSNISAGLTLIRAVFLDFCVGQGCLCLPNAMFFINSTYTKMSNKPRTRTNPPFSYTECLYYLFLFDFLLSWCMFPSQRQDQHLLLLLVYPINKNSTMYLDLKSELNARLSIKYCMLSRTQVVLLQELITQVQRSCFILLRTSFNLTLQV